MHADRYDIEDSSMQSARKMLIDFCLKLFIKSLLMPRLPYMCIFIKRDMKYNQAIITPRQEKRTSNARPYESANERR